MIPNEIPQDQRWTIVLSTIKAMLTGVASINVDCDGGVQLVYVDGTTEERGGWPVHEEIPDGECHLIEFVQKGY